MSAYRIETYTHSDGMTENKAGAMVKVSAQTDFATRTDVFKELCRKVAKLACGFQTEDLESIYRNTDLEDDVKRVSAELKEEIKIEAIVFMA